MTWLLTWFMFLTICIGASAQQEQSTVSALEAKLHKAQEQLAEIEAKCTPPKGNPKVAVEAEFGPGMPCWNINSKMPPKGVPPGDSPRRFYKFSQDGDLVVVYDTKWQVERAWYTNPAGEGGGVIYTDEETNLKVSLNKHLQRIEQMRKILNEHMNRKNRKNTGE